MKKLVLVINDLSGVGKTTVSNLIHHWHTRAGVSNSLLATNCSDEAQELLSSSRDFVTWDFNEDYNLSSLVSEIDAHDAVIVDVGSGDARKIGTFCERQQLWEILGELDVELTLAIPVSTSGEDANDLVDLAECFTDNADYVVVNRPAEEYPDGQDQWKGSYPQKALSHLGAIELVCPSFNGTLAKTLRSEGYELHEALAEIDDLSKALLKPLGRWEKLFEKQLTGDVVKYLLPDSVATQAPNDGDPHPTAIAC